MMNDATFFEDVLTDTNLPVSKGGPTPGYTFQAALRATQTDVNAMVVLLRLLRILFRLAKISRRRSSVRPDSLSRKRSPISIGTQWAERQSRVFTKLSCIPVMRSQ